jgi:hypothetical protein
VSKQTVTLILVAYLTIVWAAVIFRIDHFPLTWVPMYSVYEPSETISVKVWDKDKYRKGLKVTHRDGSISYVSYKDLNIPKPNFRRLYYSRIFGTAPPKHKQGNTKLGSINRWIRGLEEDAPNFSVDWEWRMFWTLNKTLGHEPSDPKFIVRMEADHQKRIYRKADLLQGRVGKARIHTNKAVIDWQDQWTIRWKHELL